MVSRWPQGGAEPVRFLWHVSMLLLLAILLPACDDNWQPGGNSAGADAVEHGTPVALADDRPPPLLLISLDGVRPDYLARAQTPHLDRLRAGGAFADGLVQVFPTKTFTTHFSLVTGQRVDGHGVAANSMWDPQRRERFSLRNRDAVMDPAWYDAEPIWAAAERQGLTAATYFWPGSEAPIGGSHPSYWKPYDVSVPHRERVRQVLAWLDLPADERPDLITLYLSTVDSAGHREGPQSSAVIDALEAADRDLGTLLAGLEARELLGRMHLLVVSDHGMAEIDTDRYILLDRLLPMGEVRVSDWGPAAHVWADGMSADEIVAELAGAHPRLRVWRREDTPAHYGFSSHPRVADVLLEADMGWMISTRRYLMGQRASPLRGMHGWDPLHRKMHGIWLAHGPAFRPGAELGPVEGIHLYALLAHLLQIEPAEHEGALAAWQPLLQGEHAVEGEAPPTPSVLYGARYPRAVTHAPVELHDTDQADVSVQGELARECDSKARERCRFLLQGPDASLELDLDGLAFDAVLEAPGPVRLEGDWEPPVMRVRNLLLLEPGRLAAQATR